MQILRARQEHLEQLRDFAERTFRAAFEASNDPQRFEEYCQKSFSSARFQAELAQPESAFWLVFEGETLAAYLKLNFDKNPEELAGTPTVQVERLYVAPEFQGQRIGERLLDFAGQEASARAARWIWLTVWQENPPAVRFYERNGYEIFGTKTFWLGDEAQTDWLMRRALQPHSP